MANELTDRVETLVTDVGYKPSPELARRIEARLDYPTDLLETPGLLHGAVLRSAHAHANLRHVDISRALDMPGRLWR